MCSQGYSNAFKKEESERRRQLDHQRDNEIILQLGNLQQTQFSVHAENSALKNTNADMQLQLQHQQAQHFQMIEWQQRQSTPTPPTNLKDGSHVP